MYHIAIISASVRTGRKSHNVALFFKKFIEAGNLASVEILDLKEYQFPLFDERLRFQKNPLPKAVEFSEKIKAANGIIIVTPEYNGGYPASLKNAVDLLYHEWKRKPIGLATASNGQFGGAQVTTSLVFSLWKIGAWVIPAMYPAPKVQVNYDNEGNAIDKENIEKRAKLFLDELIWSMEAGKRMTSTIQDV